MDEQPDRVARDADYNPSDDSDDEFTAATTTSNSKRTAAVGPSLEQVLLAAAIETEPKTVHEALTSPEAMGCPYTSYYV